ncbi:unnamed protein product [Zymoseptoria tritici ST99CH_1A5]|uniref:Phosphoglycerate mutase-like protein n=3 Tax=Zymoseptoria tritici TaxID=1047171 RepID=F9XE07_ZYMTI|nr:uncharacterized protein MYCGRDRAFT_43817 [Zymoseptoria tritici IPO323]EGP86592.1 hypothetical protein MYCGRDRAFT_43817 [Zymoseptoria tritici IPO323]SMQ51973.1 unnamed protein product [Zymoseptoria tritici ST99CH_3D7]SMR56428.1 unnamed protein product [Zymoseptoria tritici ST99CH_3D1]SMY25614.1 unnamed protein product [Zymoseptoria tritici ST99CH_1A5]
MAPIIHLVRHAEGYHNACDWGEKIHDPFLTDKGKGQCEELCRKFTQHDEIDLLVASPLKRTIQTCQIVFAPVVERGQKILLMPLAEETSDEPMDTGSDEPTLREAYGDLIDTSLLKEHPGWNSNSDAFTPDTPSLIDRAAKLREWLRKRPEKNIAVVSHGSFAHFIVGNIDHQGEQITRMWDNAECRSYAFLSDEDDVCQLRELDESKAGRRDLEKKGEGYVLCVEGGRRGSAGSPISA